MESKERELRRYKHEVHCYLDTLWRLSSNKPQARNTWYDYLAVQMNRDREDTHVSKFTLEDCKQALHILKAKYRQITGRRNIPKSVKKNMWMGGNK